MTIGEWFDIISTLSAIWVAEREKNREPRCKTTLKISEERYWQRGDGVVFYQSCLQEMTAEKRKKIEKHRETLKKPEKRYWQRRRDVVFYQSCLRRRREKENRTASKNFEKTWKKFLTKKERCGNLLKLSARAQRVPCKLNNVTKSKNAPDESTEMCLRMKVARNG